MNSLCVRRDATGPKKNRAPPKVSGDENENEALVGIAISSPEEKTIPWPKTWFCARSRTPHTFFFFSLSLFLSQKLSLSLTNTLSFNHTGTLVHIHNHALPLLLFCLISYSLSLSLYLTPRLSLAFSQLPSHLLSLSLSLIHSFPLSL